MTFEQTCGIMDILRMVYPQFYAKQDEDELRSVVTLWAGMFAEDDAKAVTAAVKAFIANDTKGFPPSIGQIKDKLDKLRTASRGGELTAQEAWSLVQKAVKRGYYNAQEEFDKLPDTIRAVVGGASMIREWAEIDPATLNTVVSSNFQRSYDARQVHVVEMRKLPAEVKAFIASPEFQAIGAWPKEEPRQIQQGRRALPNVVDFDVEEVR